MNWRIGHYSSLLKALERECRYKSVEHSAFGCLPGDLQKKRMLPTEWKLHKLYECGRTIKTVVRVGMKQRTVLCFTLAVALSLYVVSAYDFHLATGCYGPHITAEISATEVNINENVTVTGQICPAEPNVTVRVTFTRPDYTWIDQFVIANAETGEFAVTQTLDMAGYWNIFPIYGHICDRLYANVTNPADPLAPLPMPSLPPYKPHYSLITE